MKKKMTSLLILSGAFLIAVTSFFSKQSLPKTSIEEYLASCGFFLTPVNSQMNEGYLSSSQARQFAEQLKVHSVKSIAEIGLNAGHSANLFLTNCKGLKKFTSFDINQHPYTPRAVEYFKKYYKSFEFVEGDSSKTILEYAKNFPDQKFDLIYIDGQVTFEGCLNDIVNCKNIAHKDTTVWIDDFNVPEVHSAIYNLVGKGFIEVDSAHASSSEHGDRQWVKIRYLFK